MAAYSHIITVDPDASLWGLWGGVLCVMWGHVTWATPPPPKPVFRCTPQRAQVRAGVGKPPHGLGGCIGMPLVSGTGNSPSPGRPTPGVVKQDKSSGGSVDTTNTRSGPQRVRMGSGERPIGAAKGKQSDTEALCHPPPPPLKGANSQLGRGGGALPVIPPPPPPGRWVGECPEGSGTWFGGSAPHVPLSQGRIR